MAPGAASMPRRRFRLSLSRELTLFEFLRNNDLIARNFFDPNSPLGLTRNQFGGVLGGPIRKSKTFVFRSYEGFRQNLD
jgi:hypothetical protein